MEEKPLSIAFSDSLKDDSISCVADLAEVGLDAILEDGLFKDIPFVSSVVSLYRIGNSIRERHSVKKLIEFIKAINDNIADETKRQEYISKFNDNPKYRNRQLEYLLVLIDRYISYDKPRLLAKLYLAYLDGEIVWEEFTVYAEIIDRFLGKDCSTLISEASRFHTIRDVGAESILRLVALGLMAEDNTISLTEAKKIQKGENKSASKISNDSKKKTYKRTEFGIKLAEILR